MNQKTAIKQLNAIKKYSSKMRLAAEKWKTPWQILIAIILSARTRDEKTIFIAKKLFEKYSSPKKLANAPLKSIEEMIKPVNFYRNKSKSIIKCSKEIIERHNGKVPKKEKDLLNLSGVGRKTMNVFLSKKGKPAIGVDTHVSFISQKLGWTKNKSPVKIEEDLKKLFSKTYWSKINQALVRFGKTHTSRKKKNEILEKIKRIK